MKGHDDILAMRRKGCAPSWVCVETSAGQDRFRFGAGWPHTPGMPTLLIDPDDLLRQLDLRFLVGLDVLVSGDSPKRVRAVADACQAAMALRVVANTFAPNQFGDQKVVSTTDTDGLLTWPTT